jgi:hypothetical protein
MPDTERHNWSQTIAFASRSVMMKAAAAKKRIEGNKVSALFPVIAV